MFCGMDHQKEKYGDIKENMDTTSKALNLQFVEIPGGEFIIGSDLGYDRMSQTDERPRHRLHITQYFIMRYPVTNQQYWLLSKLPGAGLRSLGGRKESFPLTKPITQ
jgi:hypothetical protein